MWFRRRDAKRRLTGVTLPFIGGGVTWTTSEADKARARSALNFLEDRRVLFDLFEAEDPLACEHSVMEIRSHLGEVIEKCQTDALRDPLRAIQAACRQFLTDIRQPERGLIIHKYEGGISSWMHFSQVLGVFRGRVGTNVDVIVEAFDLTVDEHLRKILPPPPDP
jgi:hypothetical protein